VREPNGMVSGIPGPIHSDQSVVEKTSGGT